MRCPSYSRVEKQGQQLRYLLLMICWWKEQNGSWDKSFLVEALLIYTSLLQLQLLTLLTMMVNNYQQQKWNLFSISLSLSLSPPYSLFYSIVLVFGFEEPSYTLSESVGNGLLGVRIREDSGQVSENVVFTFNTRDGSAVGESLIPCSVPYCPCTSPCACTIVTYIEYSPSCVHYSS